MTIETLKKLVLVSNMYFFGTRKIGPGYAFWYGLLLGAFAISFITLFIAWIF